MSAKIPEPDGRSIIAVTYKLGDLYAVNLQSWRVWLRLLLFMFALIFVMEILLPLLSGERFAQVLSGVDPYLAAPLILIVVAAATITPIIGLWRRKRQGWNVPMRMHLDDEAISIEHPMGSVRTYWHAIRRVRATRSRLFLFTTPSCAYILPKRSFADAREFERWIESSRHRWAEARINPLS